MYRKINPEDYIGKRFGRLTITGRSLIGGKKGRGCIWDCLCDCGKTTQVSSGHLWGNYNRARTRSCGCLHDERSRHYRSPGEAGIWKLWKKYQQGAKKRHLEWRLNLDEFKVLTSGNCAYCGDPPSMTSVWSGNRNSYGAYVYNGIDRVDTSKGYLPDNVESCCRACNIMKWDYTKEEFLKQVEKILDFQKGRVPRFPVHLQRVIATKRRHW